MLKTHLVPSVMKAQPLPWGVLTSHSFVLYLLWLPLPPRPSLPPFHWYSPFHSASSFSPLSSSCLPVFSSASSSLSPTTIFFPLFLSLLALPPPSAARSLTELRARNTRATVALPRKVGVWEEGGMEPGQQLCACASRGRAGETPARGSESCPGGGAWALGAEPGCRDVGYGRGRDGVRSRESGDW